MIRTSKETESYILPLSRSLNLEGEPKWIFLRFMLNISLSMVDSSIKEVYSEEPGKEYRLEQITGEGKGADDHTKFYWDAIEIVDKKTISTKKELENRIQFHIERGQKILSTSLKKDSNIFDFILQEF